MFTSWSDTNVLQGHKLNLMTRDVQSKEAHRFVNVLTHCCWFLKVTGLAITTITIDNSVHDTVI